MTRLRKLHPRSAVFLIACGAFAMALPGRGEEPAHLAIYGLRAYSEDGYAVIEWQTADAWDSVGFFLDRREEGMTGYHRVTSRLLPALVSDPRGGRYRYVDRETQPGSRYSFRLTQVLTRGGTKEYGPVSILVTPAKSVQGALDAGAIPGYTARPHEALPRVLPTSAAPMALPLTSGQAGDRLRIETREKGVYHLPADAIAQNMGLSSNETVQALANRTFRLVSRGERCAYVPAPESDGIFFYNPGIQSLYTDTNVFWLEPGRGLVVPPVAGTAPTNSAPTEQTFTARLRFEENLLPAIGMSETDHWVWEVYFAPATNQYPFQVDHVAPGTHTARITVRMYGGNTTGTADEHRTQVRVNDQALGEIVWDGIGEAQGTFSVAQSLLTNGANTVELTAVLQAGLSYDLTYLNWFEVEYQRDYATSEESLLCRGEQHEVVTVTGFTNAPVQVIEIEDARFPREVEAVSVTVSGDVQTVTFRPSSSNAIYAVFSPEGTRTPDHVEAAPRTSLRSATNGTAYLVIAAPDMMAAAARLVEYRRTNGWDGLLVDVEDIYNEFSHGLVTPYAILEFLRHAYHQWSAPPTHVLLAGEGSYDYKNCLEQPQTESRLPILLVANPYGGWFAADNLFADLAGDDGSPEVALGRLPAATAGELDFLVDKIIAYEEQAAGGWMTNTLWVTDDPDGAGNFPQDSDAVAGLLPGDRSSRKVYLYTASSPEPLPPYYRIGAARTELLAGINAGVSLLNYRGHGAWNRWADEGLLGFDDINILTNVSQLSLTVALTCIINRFEIPKYDVLGEELLFRDGGGSAAVWAPTGLSLNSYARHLDEVFMQARYAAGESNLGVAVRDALRTFIADGGPRWMSDMYALLGDPAMELK